MTIQADVNETPAMSEDAAIAALVDQMKVAPKAPTDAGDQDEDEADLDEAGEDDNADEDADANEADADADGDEEDGDDTDADEGDEEEGEEGDDSPPPAAIPADDAVVKVTVNGEEKEVTVGSLKRLAGQEASLTRKSQEADQVGGRAAMMIQGALDAIVEDLTPYNDVDWLVAQQEMDPEEFKWHRENFSRSKGRYDKLIKQAGEFEQVVAGRKKAAIAEDAAAATVELAADVPGWSDKLYGDIMQYAVDQGLDESDVASIANAKVIKILHKAMMADKATTVAAKKVNQAPARVKKPSAGDEASGKAVTSKTQRNLERKLASGRATDEDAMAILMGRWKK